MKRIQKKRTKGWRMPANAVYVGRPTKWGNPYEIDERYGHTREYVIRLYENWLHNRLNTDPHFLDELRGKDLACWCPLEDKNGNPVPCHADVILKIIKERGMT